MTWKHDPQLDSVGDAEVSAKHRDALDAVRRRIGVGDYTVGRGDLAALDTATEAPEDTEPGPEHRGCRHRRKTPDDSGPVDPVEAINLAPVQHFAGRLPERVLWMSYYSHRWPDSTQETRDRPLPRRNGTVLRAGDVALLSGAGGVGKSFASLSLAVAAAAGGRDPGAPIACGLNVRPGPSAILSYEDDPRTVARRAGLIAAGSGPEPADVPRAVHLIPNPAPLMVPDHEQPDWAACSPTWRAIWSAIRKAAPSLVSCIRNACTVILR